MPSPLLSLIVNNYNYARFLPACLESVLAQDLRDTELIVVDDGSTDDSLTVLSRYTPPFRVIGQPNRGQTAACQHAFAASSGNWIWFLDADDLLLPDAFDAARAALQPGLAKISFPMTAIDASGNPARARRYLRGPFAPGAGSAIEMLWKFGHYPTPPTSANLYARAFLQHAFPAPASWTSSHTPVDRYLEVLAPFHGKLRHVPRASTAYRIHDANYGSRAASRLSREKMLHHAHVTRLTQDLLESCAAPRGIRLHPRLACQRYDVLRNLVTLHKCFPGSSPWPEDSTSGLLRLAWAAFRRQTCLRLPARLWRLAVLLFLLALPAPFHSLISRLEHPLRERFGR